MTNMKPPTTTEDSKPPASAMASTSTQTQNANNGCGSSRMNHPPSYAGTPNGSSNNGSSSNSAAASPGCFIKPSLSLNSLPPQVPPEGSEMAQNRLRIDRPYNSLKKKRDSERELWRRSWGSGHSHSSCSLQSSTATGIGKDDFWAALQTNYNFIMDTNLLDSCREARGEIGEGGAAARNAGDEDDDVDYYQKAMYKPSPMQTFYGDPRLLRQWIKEMETRIARIPSVTETKKLNIEQLLKLSGEHSEIYREIVSNSRAVAACVRAYEKKSAKASRSSSGTISGFGSLTSSSTNTTGEPSGSGSLTPEVVEASSASYYRKNGNGDGRSVAVDVAVKLGKSKDNTVVKGLERRYHLLYLKAIEIQCLLEGLLENRTSSSDNNASLSDTDEEPVNKLARLSGSVKSSSPKSPGSPPHDECLSGEEWVKAKKFSSAGFDADSEGSDCEIVPNIISYHHEHRHPLSPTTTTATNTTTNTPSTPPPTGILPLPEAATAADSVTPTTNQQNASPMAEADILNHSTISTTTAATTATATPGEAKLFSGADIIDGIIREAAAKELIAAAAAAAAKQSNDETPGQLGKSSPAKKSSGSGKQKRTKLNDLSKFNRSTRKSKNCATFYFKHLDTDSELNKDSSEQAKSEESTSSSSSSEGDEWVYNDGQEEDSGGGSSDPVIPLGGTDEDEKENKPEEDKDKAAVATAALAKEVKSKKCLDFSQEALAAAGMNLGSSRAALMMTSIGSFGKSSDSVDSGGQKGGAMIGSKEWLEKQPLDVAATAPLLPGSGPTTDCEASGEYTDSDSITRDTDSSEGLANSVATCLQGDQTSQEILNSTEHVYRSDPSNVSNDDGQVKRRVRDKPAAERPWSVSCISQLNTSAVEINQYGPGGRHHDANANQNRFLTATTGFSISESALNTMSAVRGSMKSGGGVGGSAGGGGGAGGGGVATSSSGGGSQQPLMVKSSDSKGSLKKRKMRARRKTNIVESGSDESMPPTSHQSSALHLLQHSIILQHQQQLLQQQQQQQQLSQSQPLREIQLSAGGGGSSSGGSGGHRHSHPHPAAYHQYSGHHRSAGLLLNKSESFSGRIRLADDLVTLSSLSAGSSGSGRKSSSARQTTRTAAPTTVNSSAAAAMTKSGPDSEEEQHRRNSSSSGGEQTAPMAKPNFKIGSVARARCGSLNLGSLAALANYNLDNGGTAGGVPGVVAGVPAVPPVLETDLNGTGTGTEETGSFSEQAWDNYQEKYMSEPYSEDRDTDAARRLLDFGDDYRNFIDSQSDCASSSLSAANMDSLSPPRFRRTGTGAGGESLLSKQGSSESNVNSLNRRKRLDEYRMDDRYSHNMHSWSSKSGSPPGGSYGHHHLLDKTLTGSLGRSGKHSHGILYESPDHLHHPGVTTPPGGGQQLMAGRRRSLRSVDKHNSFLRSLSHETSSSSNNEFDEDMEAEVKKLLIQSKARFANTEALKGKSHLLKPEDYDEIIKTCRENVRCLETVLLSQPGTVLTAAKCQDLRDTIHCWEKLLSWSERRQITTRFQKDIQDLKDGLDELGSKAFDFSSEAHIQLAIDQLKNERKVLQNQRPKMLTLNATVHSWVSQQELARKELLDRCAIDSQLEQLDREKNYSKCPDQKCGCCYDCLAELREDCTINRELKDGIGQLYGTWDEAEIRIKNRIENLTSSMMTWKQLEDGLSDFRDILDRDRGKLQGLEGALAQQQTGSGRSTPAEVANSVREVVKALSEKVEPLFQEHNISIPVNLKLSSSGSLSDSGISDGGGMSDGSLSEREKRLSALKRLVKQLEVSLAPGSEAMQTITKRLEMAEHDLRSLQNTCRKIIMNEKGLAGDGVDGRQGEGVGVGGEGVESDRGESSRNNNDVSVKNKNRKGSKKNRPSSPAKSDRSKSRSTQSLDAHTDSEDFPFPPQVETLADPHHHTQHQHQNHHSQQHHQAATAQLGLIQTTKLKLSQNRWVWRITKIAVPVQLALVLVMCAACFFEPHCCDALNTYSMSFTPQLRYIKGPPPV
ncbi:klarsicht protein isoform X2 [Culex pipiens pallens]|uniref:klarsicht protein isoform X2 n=1 Tax=Culex pipiens pallens TaxID=42434 RepID=UPI001954AF71|nr:klarsicht protein isoform X2 [Culex pipiens pallens]